LWSEPLVAKHAGLEPRAALPGQSQSTCLAYFTSHDMQPEKLAQIVC